MTGPDKIERYDFGGGYATTAGTLRLLASTVRKYHTHPRIRRRALAIVAGLPSMDYDGEVIRVWDFVLEHVRYTRDPLFAEYITSPVTLDEMIDDGMAQEDCEGIALYAATLFAAIGRESEFAIFGRDPSRPRRFSHCALRVLNPTTKAWTSFDPVGAWAFDGFGLGDSVAPLLGGPVEHWNLNGKREALGMLDEYLGDAYDTSKNIVGGVGQAAPAFGPYGMLVGALVQGGGAIGYGIADKHHKPTADMNRAALDAQASAGGDQPSSTRGRVPILKWSPTVHAAVEDDAKSNPPRRGLLVAGAILLGAKLLGAF